MTLIVVALLAAADGLVVVAASVLRWAAAHHKNLLAAGSHISGRLRIRWLSSLITRLRPEWRFGASAALGFAVIASAAVVAGNLVEDVTEGDGIATLDHPVARFVAVHRSGALTVVMRAASSAGGPVVLAAATMTAGVLLGITRRSWYPVLVTGVTVAGNSGLTLVLKMTLARPRPPRGGALAPAAGYAFPSGHAATAAAAFGILAYLCAGPLRSWAVRVAVWATAAMLTTLVGISRIYLGVHWTTDVLGGWVFGVLWLAIVISGSTVIHNSMVTARKPRPAARPARTGPALPGDEQDGRNGDRGMRRGVSKDIVSSRDEAEPMSPPRNGWRPADPPRRPVLFVNPRSGGGAATRARIAERARERGIEVVPLSPGQDLAALACAALADGADALGMAGGDGSLAVVAAAAARHGLPFVCVPAGTRNHFALDVGVDRRDVVGALDAFTDGVERRIDVAEVNGRLFLNNVSLGIYGDAVRMPGYRDAKARTLLQTAQKVLGPSGQVPELRLIDEAGREHRQVAVVLVSNNPYALDRPLVAGTRLALDTGRLGILVLDAPDDAPRPPGRAWSVPHFEVSGATPVHAGVDGEAVDLASPLRFTIRHAALRVRISARHPGVSPSARRHPVRSE